MSDEFCQWNEMLDEAKKFHNIKSDASLAKLIGKTINHISAGDKNIFIETVERLFTLVDLDIKIMFKNCFCLYEVPKTGKNRTTHSTNKSRPIRSI